MSRRGSDQQKENQFSRFHDSTIVAPTKPEVIVHLRQCFGNHHQCSVSSSIRIMLQVIDEPSMPPQRHL
jgi:hypothetical protein